MFQNRFRRRIIGTCVKQEAQGRQKSAPTRLEELFETRLEWVTDLLAREVVTVDEERHRPVDDELLT